MKQITIKDVRIRAVSVQYIDDELWLDVLFDRLGVDDEPMPDHAGCLRRQLEGGMRQSTEVWLTQKVLTLLRKEEGHA